jgi:hypothetical protein
MHGALECLEWMAEGCAKYRLVLESSSSGVLESVLPVLGVFVVLGIGLLLGRSVWS